MSGGQNEEAMARLQGSDGEGLLGRRASFGAGGSTRVARQRASWSGLELKELGDRQVAHKGRRRRELGYSVEDQPALNEQASLADRLMSAMLDCGIVWACFLVAVLVFTLSSAQLPRGESAEVLCVLGLGALGVFYSWLFMTWGGGSTPGMRYARLALCTFSDENATRRDAQNRIVATALALLPMGLGVLWALFDAEHLGWQDRMTKTYQRSYRGRTGRA